ncbi:MAG: pantoate--beta-alanine ligase [Actinobacteria bacterium]|nr:MAG: pantoate--beta-alanine ligase [Actinomycetota bacterium]
MKIVRTISEIRQLTQSSQARTGLVPTMGAFHDGHLSLFRAARAECDVTIVSLFVNPAQFGANDDLDRYPRDEARDADIAGKAGVDVLFAPPVEELYPAGFHTWVDPERTGAEGAHRPDHFRGVATVCLKLFNIVRPDVAYFGQKDAQQAAVLRQMVRDLNLELELRVLPTVRDIDGLALSSRNAYLSSEERGRALALPRALTTGRAAYVQGSDPIAAARAALNGLNPDYVDVLELGDAKVLAVAARVGPTRLIDNVILEGELQ